MSTKLNSLVIVRIKGATGSDPANSTIDQRNIALQLHRLYLKLSTTQKIIDISMFFFNIFLY